MHIDLIYRCYYEKSKGNNSYFDRLANWLEEGRQQFGNRFNVNKIDFEWKVLYADSLNDIINDDFTEWVFIRAIDNSFEAIGKRGLSETDNIGLPKSITFNTIWILKSNIAKLEVTEKPISIWCPHIFETPLHRAEYDFKLLIKKIYDEKVSITRFVEYKEYKTDSIKIR